MTWPFAICMVAYCGMVSYVAKHDAVAAFCIVFVTVIASCIAYVERGR